MNIMFEDSITQEVKDKYILLELDTFYFAEIDKTRKAYCLVEQTPLTEMITLNQFVNLHRDLIKNYGKKNWKFCEDALEHLVGKWNGELDTFYSAITDRVKVFKESNLPDDWSPVIDRA